MDDTAINHRANRPLLDGVAPDMAIDEARAALAALLRAPGGGEPSRLTEARARLGTLPDRGRGAPAGAPPGRPGRVGRRPRARAPGRAGGDGGAPPPPG